MKKKEKIIMIIAVIALIAVIGVIVFLNVDYFKEIKYNDVMKKINNKDSFVLVITQTTCSHCATYKPKVEIVANDYKVKIYYIEVDLLNEEQKKAFSKVIQYNGTPTTIFFVNGEEKTAATRINGDASTEKIIKKLKSNGFIK